MSKNIAKNAVPRSQGFIQTKIILKTIMVLVAIFGLTFSALTNINVNAAPSTAPNLYVVNDLSDSPYRPTDPQTPGLNGTPARTLRWAIEQVNRDCSDAIAVPTITFDFAAMSFKGSPVPSVTDVVSDDAGKYTVGSDVVYRLPLNTYLPDLVCANTIIDGETGNPNAAAAIGTGTTVGTKKVAISKIKRPAIEIYAKSNYIRPVSVANATAGLTEANQWKATRNCGLRLAAETQKVIGISIFGFGGGEYNDANICVSPYSDAAPLTQPDPRGANPEIDMATDYFPQINAISNAYINGAVVDFIGAAAPAELGAGMDNYYLQPSIYENQVDGLNDASFDGTIRNVAVTQAQAQNSTDIEILRNVIGATAALKAPSDPTFAGTYDTAKAVAMRTNTYHSVGSGISVVASDKGIVDNNIIAFNGGLTGAVAGQGSQAGVLFDVAAYGGLNTYVDDAPALNAEIWTMKNNEIYLNITNDRAYGGHGIFTNSNQNAVPGDGNTVKILNNDIYQNGGAGIRTFVPSIDIWGNKINDNGKHDNDEDDAFDVIDRTATYKVPRSYVPDVSSFKHGIWMECGDGYIFNNEIYNNAGAAVAVAGGNMYCPNGGLSQNGGNVISENSMYDNGSIGIDLYKENNSITKAGVGGYVVYDKAPTNTVEYEKPIGSEQDIDSESQKTGDASTYQGAKGSKFVSLNTKLALDSTAQGVTETAFTLATADPTDISAANERTLVGGNLNTPFPVFTYSTIDCSTNKIKIHGYVAKDNVVEVFIPDKLTVETYAEGKTYLFDFTDNNTAFATTLQDTDLDLGTYSNTSKIVGEDNLPLSAGTIDDLPYYDAASGTLKTLSTAPTPFATVDKVHADDIMEGDLASEFTVETPLKIGDVINATASDYNLLPGEVGTTSEFSPNFLIQPINVCETASIVKSWDAVPAVNPQPYSANDPLKFTITVYNESLTSTLSGFTIKDPTFDADVLKTLSCTTTEAGTPAGPFDLAALTAGVSFKPTAPIAIGGKVEFKCTETIIASPVTVAPAVITNKVTLAAFDPTKPTTLSIVKPKTGNTTAKDQTDGVTSATVNDITNAEDSITATPVSSKKLISIVKAWVTPPPTYIAGTPLDFTITITNEGTSDVTQFNLIDDNFGGLATGMACDNGFTTFAGQDIVLAAPLAPKAVLVFKCTGVLAPAPAGILTNKATLKPATGDTTTNVVMPQTLTQSDKDPKTALTVIDTPEAQSDSISVPPAGSASASIVKAWKTKPATYTAGTDLSFSITIVNEGTVPLVDFNLDDDSFAKDANVKIASCDNPLFVAPYAAQVIKPAAPIAPKGTFVVNCVASAIAAGTTALTNIATLATGTSPLTIVKPSGTQQSDETPGTTSTTDFSKDSITVPGVPLSPSYYIIKKVTTTPNEYKIGSPLSYDIEIVNSTPSINILEVKMTDDCGAAQLVPCTYTPASGTYDATTKIFKGMTWVASADGKTSSVIIKSTGTVLPTATGNITNTAKLDKTHPIDPANPSVLPVCKKDPTMPAQSDTVDTDVCDDKVVTPPAGSPKASIIKAFAPTKVDATYKLDTVVDYIITIVNEGSVDITEFNLLDDSFAGKVLPDTCVGDFSYKVGAAADVILKAPLAPKGKVSITCTGKAPASDGTTTLVNTVTLAGTAKTPLSIVAPSGTPQSDGKQTDPADIPKDSISIPPAPKDASPVMSIRKVLTSGKKTFVPLDTVTYDVVVTKISGNITVVKVDDDCAGGLLEGTVPGTPCTMTSTNPTTYTAGIGTVATGTSGTLSGVTWPASNEVVFKVTGVVKAGTTTDVKNIATLDFSVPANPLDPANPTQVAVCAIDPKMTRDDKTVPTAADCNKDNVIITPVPTAPSYYIIKKVTTTPNVYTVGSPIEYDITVVNSTPSIIIKQVKMTDDCGAGKLVPCTYTPATGTYDAATKILSGMTFVAAADGLTSSVTVKSKGTVIAGTTGDITNTAKLDPALPIDPANPAVVPVCKKDPTMPAQSDTTDLTTVCDDKVVTPPVPTVPTISIRKVLTSAKTFKPGDTVTYDVIITKIGGTVTQVKITDDCGGGMLEGATAGTPCTVTSADGTFDAATLTLTGIKWSAANEAIFKVTGVVKAGTTTNVVNVATFDPQFPADPANPVPPVCSIDPKMTRDDKTVPTAADCNKDNVIITPVLTPIYTIKKSINVIPNQYAAGDTLDYTIRITNWTQAIPIKQVKLIDDCGAGLLENCVLVPAPNAAYDTATNILSGIIWTKDASGNSSSVSVTYSGKVKATTTTNIANTAKLDPSLPIDPLNPSVFPVCATDPKMQDFTNADGTLKVCEDDVVTPPTPVLSIRKVLTSGKTTFAPGDTITYDVIITKVAGNVLQVKVSDDCGGGMLEGTPVAPATTAPCTITSTDGTFDPATGILTDAKWSATNEVVFKVSGKVKAGTTTDVVNVAKFDPNFPADPKNPLVVPVCAIDPKMTNADPASPEKCTQDEVKITPTPIADKASIVKAWDFFTGYFTTGDTLAWTVTVTNEGTTDLTKFNIKDDNFAAAPELDATTFLCTTTTPAPAFTSAQMLAGFDFVPTTALKPGEFVEFACTVVVVTEGIEGDVLENTATLAPAAEQNLTRVVPTKLQQSDLDVSTQEEIDTDHLYIEPEVFTPLPPAASIIKRWTGKNGTSQTTYYEVGDKLEFEIIIGNEGGEDIRAFTLQDDVFDNATNLSVMVCDQGFTNFKGQDFELETPIKPEGNFVIKCNVTVTAESYQTLKNTVTLIFPEGDIYQPDKNIKGRESGQSDGLVGDPANDAIDSIKISPKPKTIVPVLVTPRTGGQIAIGASILALVSVAFLTLRKRVTAKK